MNLSALMSVYRKESPEFLRQSLQSLCVQTLPADEVVIVKDGPLGTSLDKVIAEFSRRLPIVLVELPQNVGLGAALRSGVEKCRGNFIARMDSDDICVPTRFQLQMNVFTKTPGVDVVGGAIAEFISDPEMPVAIRRLPKRSDEIIKYAKSRNPLNHMTVMFRREAILEVGSYQVFSDFEDYHLWVRMIMGGSRFLNLDDILVRVRVGNGMLSRRSGMKYLHTEIGFQSFLHQVGFISIARSVYNILLRTPVRLAPTTVRQIIYRKFLRSA